MKRLIYILVAIVIVSSVSCKKSSDTPTNVKYTVQYEVVSIGDTSGNVIIDTIIYLNSSGVEVILTGETQFSHSFEVMNTYHGMLYVSGLTKDNGSCTHGLQILKEGELYRDNTDESKTSFPVSFKFKGEFQYSEE